MIIVVGGTKGLGKSVACRLANTRDDALVLAARHENTLREAVTEMLSTGRSVSGICVDLADSDSIDAFVRQIAERHDAVRAICITAAGFYKGDFLDQDLAAMETLVRTNFVGPVRLVAGIARHAKCTLPMDVIIVTSIGAATNHDASRSSAMHITTKGALSLFAEVAGRELASRGIRICTIAPGSIARSGRAGIPEKALLDCVELALQLPVEACIESIVVRHTGLIDNST